MSLFEGHMKEYERISLDRFDAKNLQSTVYFLSHLHEDHTQGLAQPLLYKRLKTNKSMFLYCSEVTEVLLCASKKYQHLAPFIKSIPVNSPTIIDIPDPLFDEPETVTVTLLPAFHCPGSVMFMFEGHEGNVIYTGDFRWEHFDIEQMHHLRSNDRVKDIQSLYVDTTFCTPENLYIPSRQQCIEAVCQLVREWIAQGPDYAVYVHLRAQYGHEPLINTLAVRLNKKIHVTKHKVDVYDNIIEFHNNFTADGTSTQIHACGKECRVIKDGEEIRCREQYSDSKVMALLPTTMYFTQFQHLTLDKVIRRMSDNFYRACYSFHSSYIEIKDLISYLRPKHIYPNVKPPNDDTIAVTQHRLNTMLKECLASGGGHDEEQETTEVKELGALRTRSKGKTAKRKKTASNSDSESLDFGTPSKKVKQKDVAISESQPAVSTRRSSRRLNTSQTAMETEQKTLKKGKKGRKRSTSPDLFVTPVKSEKSDVSVHSSYAGSCHGDEIDLTQDSHSSLSQDQSFPEISWSLGSFLTAVNSCSQEDTACVLIEEDIEQTDENYDDTPIVIDDDDDVPDNAESKIEKSSSNTKTTDSVMATDEVDGGDEDETTQSQTKTKNTKRKRGRPKATKTKAAVKLSKAVNLLTDQDISVDNEDNEAEKTVLTASTSNQMEQDQHSKTKSLLIGKDISVDNEDIVVEKTVIDANRSIQKEQDQHSETVNLYTEKDISLDPVDNKDKVGEKTVLNANRSNQTEQDKPSKTVNLCSEDISVDPVANADKTMLDSNTSNQTDQVEEMALESNTSDQTDQDKKTVLDSNTSDQTDQVEKIAVTSNESNQINQQEKTVLTSNTSNKIDQDKKIVLNTSSFNQSIQDEKVAVTPNALKQINQVETLPSTSNASDQINLKEETSMQSVQDKKVAFSANESDQVIQEEKILITCPSNQTDQDESCVEVLDDYKTEIDDVLDFFVPDGVEIEIDDDDITYTEDNCEELLYDKPSDNSNTEDNSVGIAISNQIISDEAQSADIAKENLDGKIDTESENRSDADVSNTRDDENHIIIDASQESLVKGSQDTHDDEFKKVNLNDVKIKEEKFEPVVITLDEDEDDENKLNSSGFDGSGSPMGFDMDDFLILDELDETSEDEGIDKTKSRKKEGDTSRSTGMKKDAPEQDIDIYDDIEGVSEKMIENTGVKPFMYNEDMASKEIDRIVSGKLQDFRRKFDGTCDKTSQKNSVPVKKMRFTRSRSFDVLDENEDNSEFGFKNEVSEKDLPDVSIYFDQLAYCFETPVKQDSLNTGTKDKRKSVNMSEITVTDIVKINKQKPLVVEEAVIDLTGDDDDIPMVHVDYKQLKIDANVNYKSEGGKKLMNISFSKRAKMTKDVKKTTSEETVLGNKQTANEETGSGVKKSASDETGLGSKELTSGETVLGSKKQVSDDTGLGSKELTSDETGLGSKELKSGETGLGSKKTVSDETGLGSKELTSDETGLGSKELKSGETGLGSKKPVSDETGLGSKELKSGETGLGSKKPVSDETGLGSKELKSGETGLGSKKPVSDETVLGNKEPTSTEEETGHSESTADSKCQSKDDTDNTKMNETGFKLVKPVDDLEKETYSNLKGNETEVKEVKEDDSTSNTVDQSDIVEDGQVNEEGTEGKTYLKELKDSGNTNPELKDSGNTGLELKDSGNTDPKLKDLGNKEPENTEPELKDSDDKPEDFSEITEGSEEQKELERKLAEEKAEIKRQALGFMIETDSDTDSDSTQGPGSPTGSVLYDEYIELSSGDDEQAGNTEKQDDKSDKVLLSGDMDIVPPGTETTDKGPEKKSEVSERHVNRLSDSKKENRRESKNRRSDDDSGWLSSKNRRYRRRSNRSSSDDDDEIRYRRSSRKYRSTYQSHSRHRHERDRNVEQNNYKRSINVLIQTKDQMERSQQFKPQSEPRHPGLGYSYPGTSITNPGTSGTKARTSASSYRSQGYDYPPPTPFGYPPGIPPPPLVAYPLPVGVPPPFSLPQSTGVLPPIGLPPPIVPLHPVSVPAAVLPPVGVPPPTSLPKTPAFSSLLSASSSATTTAAVTYSTTNAFSNTAISKLTSSISSIVKASSSTTGLQSTGLALSSMPTAFNNDISDLKSKIFEVTGLTNILSGSSQPDQPVAQQPVTQQPVTYQPVTQQHIVYQPAQAVQSLQQQPGTSQQKEDLPSLIKELEEIKKQLEKSQEASNTTETKDTYEIDEYYEEPRASRRRRDSYDDYKEDRYGHFKHDSYDDDRGNSHEGHRGYRDRRGDERRYSRHDDDDLYRDKYDDKRYTDRFADDWRQFNDMVSHTDDDPYEGMPAPHPSDPYYEEWIEYYDERKKQREKKDEYKRPLRYEAPPPGRKFKPSAHTEPPSDYNVPSAYRMRPPAASSSPIGRGGGSSQIRPRGYTTPNVRPYGQGQGQSSQIRPRGYSTPSVRPYGQGQGQSSQIRPRGHMTANVRPYGQGQYPQSTRPPRGRGYVSQQNRNVSSYTQSAQSTYYNDQTNMPSSSTPYTAYRGRGRGFLRSQTPAPSRPPPPVRMLSRSGKLSYTNDNSMWGQQGGVPAPMGAAGDPYENDENPVFLTGIQNYNQ